MKSDNSKRRYGKLNPSKRYPASAALSYECLRCGEVLPSSPKEPIQCRCGNIAIDAMGADIRIQDTVNARVFSPTPAAYVVKSKVREALKELADVEYQRRVWAGRSQREMSSLSEAVCGLFNDSRLGPALDKRETVFTNEIDSLLQDLRVAVGKVDDSRPAERFIDSPEMERVRRWSTHLMALLEREAS